MYCGEDATKEKQRQTKQPKCDPIQRRLAHGTDATVIVYAVIRY